MKIPKFDPRILLNFIGFKLVWASAVIGAANNILWPCYVITLLFALWQLSPKNRHPNDFQIVAFALLIGFTLDSTWQVLDLIRYANGSILAPFAPLWIMCLWLAFALTFNHALAWLRGRKIALSLFALIGAPLSYMFGSRIGAMEYLASPWLVSAVFGISWAITLNILFSNNKIPLFTKLASASK